MGCQTLMGYREERGGRQNNYRTQNPPTQHSHPPQASLKYYLQGIIIARDYFCINTMIHQHAATIMFETCVVNYQNNLNLN